MNALADIPESLDLPAFRPELAFPLLPDDMIGCVRRYSSEVKSPTGTYLFSRGQRDTHMFVVLEGSVNVYTGDEHESESVIDLTRHQFTGELNLLNEQGSLVT